MIGFAAGGPPDVVARLLGTALSDKLGVQVIVENKPGASANLASQQVARMEPDGYTILMIVATNTINQTLYPNLDFHIVNDFTPIASVMRVPNVVVVNPALPIKTIPELIAFSKANPGKLNYASSGAGSSPHVVVEMFKAMTGADLTHVPYATTNYFPDLISGQTQLMFAAIPGAMGFIRNGQLRAIAVTTEKRAAALPETPTVGESVPGYENSGWYGVIAPKGVPAPIVEKLHKEITAALNDPKIKARFPDLGGTDFDSTPAEFGKFLVSEVEKWAKVIKTQNIKPE
jgi:tripartite-type tricarboxylate transporter receptor subunit TctC